MKGKTRTPGSKSLQARNRKMPVLVPIVVEGGKEERMGVRTIERRKEGRR